MAEDDIKIKVEVDAAAATSSLQRLASSTENLASSMVRASTSTRGAESSITKFNQALQAGVTVYNLAFKALRIVSEQLERADKIDDAAAAFEELSKKAGQTADVFLNRLSAATGKTVSNLDLMIAANKALTKGLDPQTFDEVVAAAKRYADKVGIDAVDAINQFTQAIASGREQQLGQLGLLKNGIVQLKQFSQAQVEAAGTSETLAGSFEILQKKARDLGDTILNYLNKDAFQAIKRTLGFRTPDLKLPEQAQEGEKAAEVLIKVGTATDRLAEKSERAAQKISDLRDKIFDTTQLQEDILKEQDLLLVKPGASLFDSVVANLFGFADPNGTVGEAAAKAAEAKKQAEELIASLVAGTVGSGLGALKDFKVSKQETVGILGSIGAALGATLALTTGNAPLAPIGAAAGQGIIEGLSGFFLGKGDAFNNARKAIDQFTSDVFAVERLKIIIGGNLQEAFDFSFQQDFTGGTFDDAFNSLEINSRNAFTAIGVGLQQIQGLQEDVFGQLASVFAENLGASLNNLQIAVDALGISFDDLTKSILDAGDQGKLSFLEIQGALNGVAQIAQRGIPDAVGASILAFQNLQAAGIRGGRVSVDALGDIGAEALELGLSTLPQLQSQLTSTGELVPTEVQKIFDALSKFGVGSLEQLRDVSRETAFAILADAEAQGFAFASAANQVGDLVSQVLDLPNEKNITINVRANTDSTSRQILGLVRDEERRTPIGVPSL